MKRLTFALALVAATGATYAAWLGWDHTYQVNAAGVESGPYEAWQVVGCALTIGALALLSGIRRHALLAIAVVPTTFTIVWSIPASRDETGLWLVGAIMLAVGSLAGVATVSTVAQAIVMRRRSTR